MSAVLKGVEAGETRKNFEENSRGGDYSVRQNIEFAATTGRLQSAETPFLLQVMDRRITTIPCICLLLLLLFSLINAGLTAQGPSYKRSTNTWIHKYSTVTRNINKTNEQQDDAAC